jgi:hypothetical protein
MRRRVRRRIGRFEALFYRSIGWDGCPNWSHNVTWRDA